MTDDNKKRRCIARVYHRDCYRVSGGGKRHFTMHYRKDRCSRAALEDATFCRQHQAIKERGGNPVTVEWHEYV